MEIHRKPKCLFNSRKLTEAVKMVSVEDNLFNLKAMYIELCREIQLRALEPVNWGKGPSPAMDQSDPWVQ